MKTTPLQRISKIIRRSSELIACNIYVSAGRRQYAEPLLNLLQSSQEKCKELRAGGSSANASTIANAVVGSPFNPTSAELDKNNALRRRIAVVHAYADGPYDRSSFHIAGNADCVFHLASHIALGAIDALSSLSSQQQDADSSIATSSATSTAEDRGSSQHPLVGLVDHISVMPLSEMDGDQNTFDGGDDDDSSRVSMNSNENDVDCNNDNGHDVFIPHDIHGMVAVSIANSLSQQGVEVIPYASADPENTPLSTVRKKKTSFFKSGGLSDNDEMHVDADAKESKSNGSNLLPNKLGICTIGSPQSFVENFNIRLTKNVSKKQAMRLTKMVRERDGGIIGVEALTLPYSENRYEVACNLLRPDVGTVNDILEKVHEWVLAEEESNELLLEHDGDRNEIDNTDNVGRGYFIDDAYRVGTTVQQCMDTLFEENLDVDDGDKDLEDKFRHHDSFVTGKFRGHFS